MLKGLSNCAPTYLIAGNHDYRADQDVPDMISSIIGMSNLPNVEYLENTGTYEAGEIGFSLVSVKDTIKRGSTNMQVGTLPDFPSDFSAKVKTRIALFHGTVNKCKLQNYKESSEGYPLEWLKGHDIILLGDIHLQQMHNINSVTGEWLDGKTPWGYSSSLVQQNFGETAIFGHGYIHWDLVVRRSTLHSVQSNT